MPHDLKLSTRGISCSSTSQITYTKQCSALENAGEGFSDQKSQRRTPLSFLTRSERAMNGSIT